MGRFQDSTVGGFRRLRRDAVGPERNSLIGYWRECAHEITP